MIKGFSNETSPLNDYELLVLLPVIVQERQQNGSFKDNYGAVVQSNLPEAFTVRLPIFKGTAPEDLEVELYASVDGRDVTLSLVSPSANQMLEEQRDKVIDEQVAAIRQIFPTQAAGLASKLARGINTVALWQH